ncbi:MAG: EamA family transporter [Actinomyces sp.]|nr:MAG: EamA family transporter [Actinomyces sp.]
MPYQLAALAAATSWALSSLVAAGPVREIGGPRFTRLRMIVVSVVLAAITSVAGTWGTLRPRDLALVAASGILGLLIGDAALFTAMARMGPRRTSIAFSTNAPMAAVLGVLVFDERFTARSLVGAVAVVAGVVLAIAFGSAPDDDHAFEGVEGRLAVGVAWALLGALGQAGGAVLAKPALDAGADTIAVAATRAVIATVGLWLFARPLDRVARPARSVPLTLRHLAILVVSGLLAMVIGMTLLLYALGHGDVGVATILSSTSPVLLLPLLWLVTGRRPVAGAWAGALLAVAGIALLV